MLQESGQPGPMGQPAYVLLSLWLVKHKVINQLHRTDHKAVIPGVAEGWGSQRHSPEASAAARFAGQREVAKGRPDALKYLVTLFPPC
ncbi:hypothetical protein VAWG001_15840 [Aeromonas dhakensis]|nr:hypothetical protein VAWG001_15840 [Aeromonas dhakensis]